MGTDTITEEYAMAAGLERAQALAETHGISSAPVLDCLTRWGRIIDDARANAQ